MAPDSLPPMFELSAKSASRSVTKFKHFQENTAAFAKSIKARSPESYFNNNQSAINAYEHSPSTTRLHSLARYQKIFAGAFKCAFSLLALLSLRVSMNPNMDPAQHCWLASGGVSGVLRVQLTCAHEPVAGVRMNSRSIE